jgi:hypothetical protein
MNKSLIAAVVALTASFGALAQEATVFPDAVASSTVTRAEVRAEAREALRNGVSFGGEATL